MVLDPDEVHRINRIAIAEFLGVLPAQVDDMPQNDVDDLLEYLWARQELNRWKR